MDEEKTVTIADGTVENAPITEPVAGESVSLPAEVAAEPEAQKKTRRKRRTKAEIEADAKKAAAKAKRDAKKAAAAAEKVAATAVQATKDAVAEGKQVAEKLSRTRVPVPEIVVQYAGDEIGTAALTDAAVAQFKSSHKRTKITEFKLYVKPEDRAAYYVINGDFSGKIDF